VATLAAQAFRAQIALAPGQDGQIWRINSAQTLYIDASVFGKLRQPLKKMSRPANQSTPQALLVTFVPEQSVLHPGNA
jgi:hypothetical protein